MVELAGGVAKVLDLVVKPTTTVLVYGLPRIIKGVRALKQQFDKLPQNLLTFGYGATFCFFGGTFPTLFAALQAAEYGGRKTVLNAVNDLADEALVILHEMKKDDQIDNDEDGKKDVESLSGMQLLNRKTLLVLKKMNPEKIDKAIGSIYKVWVSVTAVLSVEFARTISMALAIADFLNKPCDRFINPVLKKMTPDDYDKWVPVIMSWISKSIAMSIAWYVQSVITGVSSSFKGGLIMAEATVQACKHRKITVFGLMPEDAEKSIVDEILAYTFAGMGFYVQFQSGFRLSAPWNVIFWPLEVAEYYIRWTITEKRA